MDVNDHLPLSDRQARAVIIAAERLGFERDPDLSQPWLDYCLHEDARYAARHLQARDPGTLRDALTADEPIAPDVAGHRITKTGRFSLADAHVVIDAAAELGFTPPSCDLPLMAINLEFDRAEACVAFLWEHHPQRLAEVVGERAQLAPPPPSVYEV